jgi:outer membrane cobalamin receptor
VFGNPDLRPEKTVQYQVGYKNAISDWVGVDVSMFYKDIRDLLGVEFISTYTQAQYARYTNVDFGNVVGFTVTLNQRARRLLSTSVDYTWQMARGNSSEPGETLTRAQAGEDPRPRKVPLNWDQRHTLNVSATLARPRDFSVSALIRASSGQPYTPATETGFGHGLEANSGTKPASMVVDLRAEKTLQVSGRNASVFGRVFNLFDTRFNNGMVFATSGSPYYSRYPVSDQVSLADPTRFYQPRRVEFGLAVSLP